MVYFMILLPSSGIGQSLFRLERTWRDIARPAWANSGQAPLENAACGCPPVSGRNTPACRSIALARGRTKTALGSSTVDGKEGVSGSSPEGGFTQTPHNRGVFRFSSAADPHWWRLEHRNAVV